MMKRAFIFLFLLIAFSRVGYGQFATPEFQLQLMSTDTAVYQNITSHDTIVNGVTVLKYDTTYSYDTVVIGSQPPGTGGRSIGYDPLASDVFNHQDSLFGEDSYYPGGFGFGNDFYFTRPDGSETRVDIRHKPLDDSFALDYSMGLSFEDYPGSVFWDTTRIPYFIKGIWIRTSYDTTPLVDMKKTNVFIIPNQFTAATWGNLVVTIFYNMQPHYLPPAAVKSASGDGGGLIISASVFPNPMLSSGMLDLSLNDHAAISILGYDALGREVLRMTKNEPAGENQIDLSAASSTMLASVRGAIMLRVDASSGTRLDTKTVMLVKE